MRQNSTPFDVVEYDKQIKRTLPFYEEMVQQIIDVARLLDLRSLQWLDVGQGNWREQHLKILLQTVRMVQD